MLVVDGRRIGVRFSSVSWFRLYIYLASSMRKLVHRRASANSCLLPQIRLFNFRKTQKLAARLPCKWSDIITQRAKVRRLHLMLRESKCEQRSVPIEVHVCARSQSCIVHVLSGNLESDTCYYPKNMNEIISSRILIYYCTVYLKLDMSLAACCVGNSCAYKFISRRPDPILNFHLESE
jgi:hypothetical protein